MAYLSDFDYYTNESNHGSYQYVSLEDIVNNFTAIYTGNHSLVNNEERFKVIFHAKKAIQELNYDAFKEVKVLELDLTDQLLFVMPPNYVNLVRLSVYEDGVLKPLFESTEVKGAQAYIQGSKGEILFDGDGNILEPERSSLDSGRFEDKNQYPIRVDEAYMKCYRYPIGGRYGLETSKANINPTYQINRANGTIVFDSTMSGKLCVMEYISDGLNGGDDSSVSVNKLFEDYVYAYIEWAILNSKLGVQEYVINRARKRKAALLRNARIRIKNMRPNQLIQSIRGMDKWIK